tara:strand:+ start:126 stop:251 length:126 start_codon:yes stop_codon:yes gene_type:complete
MTVKVIKPYGLDVSKKDVDFPNITFGKNGFDQVGNITILHY